MNKIRFAAEKKSQTTDDTLDCWKILVIDDEEAIHVVTRAALSNARFFGKGLEFLSAHSGEEAKTIVSAHNDIAVALVDVVMETPQAGLDLVNFIRCTIHNDMIRLVIRTGQANEAPEHRVIEHYDIDDYKEKTELTAQKLYITVRNALKQFQQLIELKSNRDEIYKKMTTHALSELPNRIKLLEELDTGGDKSVLMVNIDGFSLINDSQGFDIGDQLLCQVGGFLRRCYSNKLTQVYHLEADIFALLFTGDAANKAALQADAIKQAVQEANFTVNDIKYVVNITVGVAINEQGNLIQKAEIAMKEARSFGRNRVQFYSKDLNIIQTIHSNLKWSKIIRDALTNGDVKAYFQPIVHTKSMKIEKYEALVRLKQGDTIHSPVQFMEAARFTGQLFSIFKVMLSSACQTFVNKPFAFSVNVSEEDLKEPEVIDYIEETLSRFSIAPNKITFELLEHADITNNSLVCANLDRIAEMGIAIAIDDFGAHCSNFGQMANLPVSILKIDGAFVQDVHLNKNSRAVVETILTYAQRRGLTTVAEYVHCKEVLEVMSDMGVDFLQGYYLGEPQPL